MGRVALNQQLHIHFIVENGGTGWRLHSDQTTGWIKKSVSLVTGTRGSLFSEVSRLALGHTQPPPYPMIMLKGLEVGSP